MDIRNIPKMDLIKVDNLNHFNQLVLEKQNNLISHYSVIEKLPTPPVNLNTKFNQTMVKDFSARVVEELGEMYESYHKNYTKLFYSLDFPEERDSLRNGKKLRSSNMRSF